MRIEFPVSLVITVLLFPAFSIGVAAESVVVPNLANSQDKEAVVTSPDGQTNPKVEGERTAEGENSTKGQASRTSPNAQSEQPAAKPNPTKLHCKAARTDLGMYEPLRIMSTTVDPAKKYVKVVHEGDGQTFEFTDGSTSAKGYRNFVRVTDETIVYGQRARVMED